MTTLHRFHIAGLALATIAFGVPALCVHTAPATQPAAPVAAAPAAGATTAGEQQTFESPEAALKALREATAANDKAALERIFGPKSKDLMNPDAVQQAHECEEFHRHLTEMANLVRRGEDTVVVYIGEANWPMPIPLARKEGKWFFDMVAGRDEILSRRIGENELNTIDVCRAYVVAQNEFHAVDWNGDDILEYAQHLKSSAEKKDGLYWDAAEDEPQSPMGPLVAEARAEGYMKERTPEQIKAEGPRPFHGYYFKILTKQGKNAPGGAYDYVINGHMVAGFALLAYPAEWGNSGVMTFIVGPRGKVYQKNLGDKTGTLAPAIGEFDPDESWRVAGE